jgi:hypothetical protein
LAEKARRGRSLSISNRQILDALYEAQQRSMQRLLEAWDQEIQAQAKAFEEAKKKQSAERALNALQEAAADAYLQGQIAQALAGYDVTISAPEGVRFASDLVQVATDLETQHLFDRATKIDPDLPVDQRSVLWALGHGFVPHPEDLATLMDRQKVDGDWSKLLHGLASKLDTIGDRGLPQLQTGKLDVLQSVVGVLKAYPSDRLLILATEPKRITSPLKIAPPGNEASTSGPKMGQAALNRVLDGLPFGRA